MRSAAVEEGDCSEELMVMLQNEMGHTDHLHQQPQEQQMEQLKIRQSAILLRSQKQKQEQQRNIPLDFDPKTAEFTYRTIRVTDRDRVKELHEEWFPVRYQDEFYDELAENHLSGNPLFTLLAIHKQKQSISNGWGLDLEAGHDESDDTNSSHASSPNQVKRTWTQRLLWGQQQQQQEEEAQTSTLSLNDRIAAAEGDGSAPDRVFTHDVDDENNVNLDNAFCVPIRTQNFQISNHQAPMIELDTIAGCVVGSFMAVTRLSPPMQDLLISDPLRYRRLFYIMTLGTESSYRGAGLGTKLVQQCIAKVQEDATCGVLYLHVLTENFPAIHLYERLGFYRVQEIPDYYDIQGVKHPCYLYAKYFHGNQGHLDVYKIVARCVWSFCSKVMQLASDAQVTFPFSFFPSNLLTGGQIDDDNTTISDATSIHSGGHEDSNRTCETVQLGVPAQDSDPGV